MNNIFARLYRLKPNMKVNDFSRKKAQLLLHDSHIAIKINRGFSINQASKECRLIDSTGAVSRG